MLESLISSKTRLKLLIKFFIDITNNSHLRGLANEYNDSTNSIRKELNNLYNAGYLVKNKKLNKIDYSANSKHPLFPILKKLIRNHLGIEKLVSTILKNVGKIDKIILLGDYAKGVDSGIIQVYVKGKKLNYDYLSELYERLEKKINRKIIMIKNIDNNVDKLIVFENE